MQLAGVAVGVAGLSAREKARLKRLAKKRPAHSGAQKGGSNKKQVAGKSGASALAEVRGC